MPGSTGWVPIGRLVSGCSALYETHVGTVSVVWLDPRLLSFTLYSGSLIPGGGPYLDTAPISAADAVNLVAAFNSGFKNGDSHGGYFVEGRAEVPLVDGIASAVIFADGTMQIGTWGSEVSMTPDVVSVRQNMTLLIDNGVINPATSSEPYSSWGITWPGGATTNRSALGVTAQGAELFAGGVGLSVPQITQAIASTGAVRAMELDVNDIYPNFSIFTPSARRTCKCAQWDRGRSGILWSRAVFLRQLESGLLRRLRPTNPSPHTAPATARLTGGLLHTPSPGRGGRP